ncbi:hypothetical protein [Dictyobacter aurantiacus]|uniref:Uncharacterized protein n=1 Tax=Dictyobacter aurantiacus TaxID=1936993 RepID=A0A401ZFH5_9CHLR|nr:hypothetical protein [Dictyobacter aurantiacus]GCE05617.1 hypothetical protein KDAU_29460 [Dictyobacter aurantiacus]
MNEEIQQDDRTLSVHRLPVAYYLVIADERVVYEGTDDTAVSGAFWRAGKGGARSVACFVNGVKVTYSRAVSGR